MICKEVNKQSYCVVVSPFVLVRMNFLKSTKQIDRMYNLISRFMDEYPTQYVNCDSKTGKLYIDGEYTTPKIACYYKDTDPKPST